MGPGLTAAVPCRYSVTFGSTLAVSSPQPSTSTLEAVHLHDLRSSVLLRTRAISVDWELGAVSEGSHKPIASRLKSQCEVAAWILMAVGAAFLPGVVIAFCVVMTVAVCHLAS